MIATKDVASLLKKFLEEKFSEQATSLGEKTFFLHTPKTIDCETLIILLANFCVLEEFVPPKQVKCDEDSNKLFAHIKIKKEDAVFDIMITQIRKILMVAVL